MMQFHKVMYPVFARFGVKLITRNMAQGGLGTIQAGLGSSSIYGDEVDLLLWDSGKKMTFFLLLLLSVVIKTLTLARNNKKI
jgi:hypothetical protein